MPHDEEEPIPLAKIIRSLETLHERHQRTVQSFARSADIEIKALRDKIATYDAALLYRDCLVDALEDVISGLCLRIERTNARLRQDNTRCEYSEPLELITLLGRSFDPTELKRNARMSAHTMKRDELARQAKDAFSTPCATQFDVDSCAGVKGHAGDCTPNADDIPAQTEVAQRCACGEFPTPFPRRHGAKGCAPKIVRCHCGKNWVEGASPVNHTEAECWIPCRVCGHHEDRHTEELPEEGGENCCAECPGIGSFLPGNHTYDGARSAEWDRCRCGHQRGEHKDDVCAVCLADEAHQFALKIR
jgi:hypothetical protein